MTRRPVEDAFPVKNVKGDIKKAERLFGLVFIRGRDAGIEDEDEAAFIVLQSVPLTEPLKRVMDTMVVILIQKERDWTKRAVGHLDTSS